MPHSISSVLENWTMGGNPFLGSYCSWFIEERTMLQSFCKIENISIMNATFSGFDCFFIDGTLEHLDEIYKYLCL